MVSHINKMGNSAVEREKIRQDANNKTTTRTEREISVLYESLDDENKKVMDKICKGKEVYQYRSVSLIDATFGGKGTAVTPKYVYFSRDEMAIIERLEQIRLRGIENMISDK